MTSEIKELNGLFFLYVDGEHDETYDTKDEAEDAEQEILATEHDYYCEHCRKYFYKTDIEYRTEDERFILAEGDRYVSVGSVNYIPVCPDCDSDMEECR
jgi:Zn finger protein HypA/HybF involved in hydrogenase expression